MEYGKKDGAKMISGGKRVGDKGYFVEPTLFAGVTDDMRIAKDEIFGPVLSVLKFKNVDEIVRRSNATNFGLAAAVWTRDVAKRTAMLRACGRAQCGSIVMTCSMRRPHSAASNKAVWAAN